MILDSTFLIDVLRGSSSVAELIEEIDASGTPFVSSVTVMELHEGIRLADASAAERDAVEAVLSDIDELPFENEVARRAGEINAELVSSGSPIDETDVMIGATGLVSGTPVVTRNTDHFERIDGLEVISY